MVAGLITCVLLIWIGVYYYDWLLGYRYRRQSIHMVQTAIVYLLVRNNITDHDIAETYSLVAMSCLTYFPHLSNDETLISLVRDVREHLVVEVESGEFEDTTELLSKMREYLLETYDVLV